MCAFLLNCSLGGNFRPSLRTDSISVVELWPCFTVWLLPACERRPLDAASRFTRFHAEIKSGGIVEFGPRRVNPPPARQQLSLGTWSKLRRHRDRPRRPTQNHLAFRPAEVVEEPSAARQRGGR